MSDWFDKITASEIDNEVDNMEFEDTTDEHQYGYRFDVTINDEYIKDCDKIEAARKIRKFSVLFEYTKEISAYHITVTPISISFAFDYNPTSTLMALYFIISLNQALRSGLWLSYSLYSIVDETVDDELDLSDVPTIRNNEDDVRNIEKIAEKLYHFFHIPGLDCKDAAFKYRNGKEMSEWLSCGHIVSKHEWWDDSLYNYTYEYIVLKSDFWSVHTMKLCILCLLNYHVIQKGDGQFPMKCMTALLSEFDWTVPVLIDGFRGWAHKKADKISDSCKKLKRKTPKAIARHISSQLNKITLNELYRVRDSILCPEPGEFYDIGEYLEQPKMHLK